MHVTKGRTYIMDDVRLVAKNKVQVVVDPTIFELVQTSFEAVSNNLSGDIYGLTTGVADLSKVKPTISASEAQKNILLSHSVGVGESLPSEVVRAAIFCRLLCFSKGMSGVSPGLIQFLVDILNNDIIPIVPSLGSVGAGDLTVLAGTFVMLCNKGQVIYQGETYAPYDAYEKAGISFPKELKIREGLALICGNEGSLALTCLLLSDIEQYETQSLMTMALSFEGRTGTSSAFNLSMQKTRYSDSQMSAAKQLQDALDGSTQIARGYKNDAAAFLQDPPSFKTTTSVLGNLREAHKDIEEILSREINGVTDNPMFIDGRPVSSGAYLCTELATALDRLALAVGVVAQSSVAHIQILLNDEYNEGLPQYLMSDFVNNSGFMICAYAAQSTLSELRALLYPRSSFSMNVANGWEDISSNAMNTALNATRILALAKEILAIERALALQAMALRRQKDKAVSFGKITSLAYAQAKRLCRQKNIPFPVKNDFYVNDFLALFKDEIGAIGSGK